MSRRAKRAGRARDKDQLKNDEIDRAALIALAPASVALAVYLLTLCPDVGGGDSGELATVAATLGIAHPPGYPVYTLLGYLFTKLVPFGTVAARVNALSAVLMAAAVGVLARAVHLATRNAPVAVIAALVFAFSPLVWTYAVVAEVFALHLLFVAIWLILMLSWSARTPHSGLFDRGGIRLLRGLALVFGLAAAHHHTLALFALPTVFFVVFHARRERAWGTLLSELPALLGIFLVSGFLPYLYLVEASHRAPLISWGDLSTWDGFRRHLLREEYGTFRLGIAEFNHGGLLGTRLLHFAEDLSAQISPFGIALAIYGFWILIRPKPQRAGTGTGERGLAWLLAGSIAFYVLWFSYLSNLKPDLALHRAVQARFWMQPLVPMILFVAWGLSSVLRRFENNLKWVWPAVAAVVLALAGARWRAQDQSGNHHFARFARSALDSVAPESLLIVSTDFATNALRYVQSVEGYRRDVMILNQHLLAYPWHGRIMARYFSRVLVPEGGIYNPGGYTMRQFLDLNRGRFRVYSCNGFTRTWDQSPENVYHSFPVGFVEEILPINELPQPLEAWIARADAGFRSFDPSVLDRYGDETWERSISELFWGMRRFFAGRLSYLADRAGKPRVLYEQIALILEDVAARAVPVMPETWKNLGIAYRELSNHDPARFTPKMVDAFTRYLAAPTPGDPELSQIRQLTSTQSPIVRPSP